MTIREVIDQQKSARKTKILKEGVNLAILFFSFFTLRSNLQKHHDVKFRKVQPGTVVHLKHQAKRASCVLRHALCFKSEYEAYGQIYFLQCDLILDKVLLHASKSSSSNEYQFSNISRDNLFLLSYFSFVRLLLIAFTPSSREILSLCACCSAEFCTLEA